MPPNKYKNPKADLSSREYLDISSPTCNLMIKEVYERFRSVELINYCASHHQIITRAAKSLHDNCIRYTVSIRVLGNRQSWKLEIEREFFFPEIIDFDKKREKFFLGHFPIVKFNFQISE